jgi:hypothetical protein
MNLFSTDMRDWLRASVCIALLSFALMTPAYIAPPMMHDSFWIDWVWADQFNMMVRQGTLYPRWLPLSHEGLGSPTFYFYPPGAFWLTAIFSLTGLTTYQTILAAFTFAFVMSGLTMYGWLRPRTSRPLLGALFYVAAPYHVCDFYLRGALAESCAFAVLPLVAVSLDRCMKGEGWLPLAFAYAALIYLHLPAALLTSLFFIAPTASHAAWQRRHTAPLRSMILGCLLGLGLAALYLVPALTLQRHIDVGKLWALPLYQPRYWNLFSPATLADPVHAPIFGTMLVLLGGASLALLRYRSSRNWSLYALVISLLVAGALPFLWTLPLVERIQFPWRAIMLIEFAVATALASATVPWVLGLLYVTPALFNASLFLSPIKSSDRPISGLRTYHPDVLEYLPRGTTTVVEIDEATEAVTRQRRHPLLVEIDGRSVSRRFYFPIWQAVCQGTPVPTSPDPQLKLVSWQGSGCKVVRTSTPQERIGGVISLFSLLPALTLARRFRRRRTDQSEAK